MFKALKTEVANFAIIIVVSFVMVKNKESLNIGGCLGTLVKLIYFSVLFTLDILKGDVLLFLAYYRMDNLYL